MNAVTQPIYAPFPWFGGKRTVAAEVWARLGKVANYVEPFLGSGAVLLARPDEPSIETVNDCNHFLANLFRAIVADPASVAYHADYPITETDLQARHYWLVTEGAKRIEACAGNTSHFDTQVAGWWLWGACAWIGSGWCSGEGPWSWDGGEWINRQMPHVGNAGQDRTAFILKWLQDISSRLRHTRIACGDWSRVCGESVTWRHGTTGMFLDPPYGVQDRATVYSHDCRDVAAQARAWAIAAGQRPDMRIAFAGYAGEHEFPADWDTWSWKAKGGYGSQGEGQGRENAGRETIWFSPACAQERNKQAKLFF